MKIYKCKVRAQGNPFDETRQKDVTPGEIRLLRAIHGEDAVLEITETGSDDRTAAQERKRLEGKYGERAVAKLFGAVQQTIDGDIGEAVVAEPAPEPKAEEKPLPVVERPKSAETPESNLFS